MSPAEWARRLTTRANVFQANHDHNTHPDIMQADMAILHEANANDWAEIGKDPAVKLAVCRELLHKYWDLSRLRTMKEG